jgi:hypothetical protein
METSGFRLAKENTFLPYQYFLVFEAKLQSPGPVGAARPD